MRSLSEVFATTETVGTSTVLDALLKKHHPEKWKAKQDAADLKHAENLAYIAGFKAREDSKTQSGVSHKTDIEDKGTHHSPAGATGIKKSSEVDSSLTQFKIAAVEAISAYQDEHNSKPVWNDQPAHIQKALQSAELKHFFI